MRLDSLGDSRALLSRKDDQLFATRDHKPKSPTEKKRIEEAGGAVVRGRVNANLALSRGFPFFAIYMKSFSHRRFRT